MNKLFFAKMTVQKQYSGKFYKCPEKWLNGVSEGDYCFVVYNKLVRALWKVKEIEIISEGNDDRKVIYEEILKFQSPKGISIFSSLKLFKLNLATLNYCQKSTKGKGFHEITLQNRNINDLVYMPDLESYINSPDSYRKIYFYSDKTKVDPSRTDDIQIYLEDDRIKLCGCNFMETEIFNKFNDYRSSIITFKNKKKISVINRVQENIDAAEGITPEKLSIIAFYDTFFVKPHPKSDDKAALKDEANGSQDEEETDEEETDAYVYAFEQTIFYGVPGSGKSYCVDELTKDLDGSQKVRVVFHPDYSNSDFIGQILPVITGKTVEYKFIPGPFSVILKNAYINPSQKYCLIIEEINRGNAAAIFGDIFQLLDRNTDRNDCSEYGWSKYPIRNDNINRYLRDDTELVIGDFSEESDIRLPPNLSIVATMNTSDQNVFTLDNAFQRRWSMKLVPNKFKDTPLENIQAQSEIGDTGVTWKDFQEKINEKISQASEEQGLSSMEDKRLGCWFVKNEGGIISMEDFCNKVLKYLWDDAFKFSRKSIFLDTYKSLEDVITDFHDKKFGVFQDENFFRKSGEQ